MVSLFATKLGTIRNVRNGTRLFVAIRRMVATIYNDINHEHMFVFAAGLSYYFVLSLFPLLILLAAALTYLPILVFLIRFSVLWHASSRQTAWGWSTRLHQT